jgi:hypothetical protein
MKIEDLRKEWHEAAREGDYRRAAAAHAVFTHMEKLESAAANLARRMNELVENLRTNGADASVNSLGEVQSLGLEVDRECALLDMARSQYREEARATEPTPAEQGEAAARQEAATRKPKTYAAHDRKGRPIRVTIPEE